MTRQAVLKRKQQSVVGRGATVVQSHNRVVVRTLTWVEQCQRTARLRIRCRGAWARRRESVLSSVAISWNVHGRIQSLRTPEVNRARSEITCLCQPVRPNLLFDTEIPLIKIGRMVVHRNADVWRLRWKNGILAECVRERISAGETLPGIRKTARRTVVCDRLSPRRLVRIAVIKQRGREIIKHSPGSSHGHASVSFRIPGKADARRPIVELRLHRP